MTGPKAATQAFDFPYYILLPCASDPNYARSSDELGARTCRAQRPLPSFTYRDDANRALAQPNGTPVLASNPSGVFNSPFPHFMMRFGEFNG